MALRRLDAALCQQLLQTAVKAHGVRAGSTSLAHLDPYVKIGKREVVGYGYNGGLNYVDRADFPMPAIRFKEPSNEIQVLCCLRSLYSLKNYVPYFVCLVLI